MATFVSFATFEHDGKYRDKYLCFTGDHLILREFARQELAAEAPEALWMVLNTGESSFVARPAYKGGGLEMADRVLRRRH